MRHGELRTDLDLLEVAEWLALIQFIRSGWPDRLDFSRPDDPGHRKLLKTFVLQAFLPVGVTETSGPCREHAQWYSPRNVPTCSLAGDKSQLGRWSAFTWRAVRSR